MRRLLVHVVLLGTLLGSVAGTANAAPLRLGFFDGLFGDASAAPGTGGESVAGVWLDRVAGNERSDVVRIAVDWAAIAPKAPRNPGDWRDPGYNWRGPDFAINAARARGLSVLANVITVPRWAQGAGRPRSAGAAVWRPRPRPFKQFLKAISARYSGRNPGLGRVDAWQLLNEPNLGLALQPQWIRRRGRLQPESPNLYRAMVNAGYAGVKAGNPRALVVTAGLSPYGDRPGGSRMAPVTFWRALLSRRVAFDVASHHPYSFYGPFHSAFSREDVAVPDLGRIQTLMRSAVSKGRLVPRRHKRFWVTEISWDSSPPDPHGVPAEQHARRLAGTMYELWRQGVDTVTWTRIRDDPGPDFAASFQAGTYTYGAKPKPAAQAFRFPFVAVLAPRRRDQVRLWGRSPVGGRLVLERRTGTRWVPVARMRARPRGVFDRTVRGKRGQLYRARLGSESSLTWLAGSSP